MLNKIIMIIFSLMLASCASSSTNMRIGQSQTYTSLADQRDAVKTVSVIQQINLEEYKFIGKVEASRCHRNFLETKPNLDNVIVDLQASAYAKGADAISNLTFDDSVTGALFKNCWYIQNGFADAYVKL